MKPNVFWRGRLLVFITSTTIPNTAESAVVYPTSVDLHRVSEQGVKLVVENHREPSKKFVIALAVSDIYQLPIYLYESTFGNYRDLSPRLSTIRGYYKVQSAHRLLVSVF